MNKEVLISVKGTQLNEFGEIDQQELITKGNLFLKKGAYFIMYNESELTGMSGTVTTLKVEPARVTLNRMGTSEQKQVFERGVLHRGSYITPFGKMVMGVTPSKVEVNLTDFGGSINLEYELEVGSEKISDNMLSITVKEV